VSMASFNKKGPRSGLSRDDSSMRSSCSVFLEGLVFGLEKEGDGVRFRSGDGVLFPFLWM